MTKGKDFWEGLLFISLFIFFLIKYFFNGVIEMVKKEIKMKTNNPMTTTIEVSEILLV